MSKIWMNEIISKKQPTSPGEVTQIVKVIDAGVANPNDKYPEMLLLSLKSIDSEEKCFLCGTQIDWENTEFITAIENLGLTVSSNDKEITDLDNLIGQHLMLTSHIEKMDDGQFSEDVVKICEMTMDELEKTFETLHFETIVEEIAIVENTYIGVKPVDGYDSNDMQERLHLDLEVVASSSPHPDSGDRCFSLESLIDWENPNFIATLDDLGLIHKEQKILNLETLKNAVVMITSRIKKKDDKLVRELLNICKLNPDELKSIHVAVDGVSKFES